MICPEYVECFTETIHCNWKIIHWKGENDLFQSYWILRTPVKVQRREFVQQILPVKGHCRTKWTNSCCYLTFGFKSKTFWSFWLPKWIQTHGTMDTQRLDSRGMRYLKEIRTTETTNQQQLRVYTACGASMALKCAVPFTIMGNRPLTPQAIPAATEIVAKAALLVSWNRFIATLRERIVDVSLGFSRPKLTW